MMAKAKLLVLLILAGILSLTNSCALSTTHQKVSSEGFATSDNPLLYGFNEVIRFGDLKEGDITEATDETLSKGGRILNEIVRIEDDTRTFENTMLRLDDLYNVVKNVWNPVDLIGAVHTSKAIRDEADSSSIRFSKFMNALSVNEDLYKAVVAYGQTREAEELTGERARFYDDILQDFVREGIGLPPEQRRQLKAIKDRISELGLQFDKNISDYADTLVVTGEQIEGLPESYKKSHAAGDGTYKIDISYPSRRPFMRFSRSEEARRALSEKFLNRAADENLKIIPRMVAERQKLAKLLGYPSYAQYLLEDRMPQNSATVWKFEEELKRAIREKAEQEHAELLELKRRINGEDAHEINYWELHYLENILFERKYQLDDLRISEYFELNNVLNGLFDITQKLFGLQYVKVDEPNVWYPDVEMYEVHDSETGNLLGHFYLDLYPREGKYSHAAMFSLVKGKSFPQGYQKPVAALVTNFPKPTEDQPSLLRHGPYGEVETFFHEFGHLVHALVTTADLCHYSGTEVDRDFVEAPSQILENWVWNKESLKLFAKHYKTGDVIPDTLVDKMLAAKNMSSGSDMAFQVFLGILDMTLHDAWNPNSGETLLEVARRLHGEILTWNETPGTARIASFGHLHGYAASYYGYAWSRVFAQDMFSVFEQNGVLDAETGRRFREVVLAPGGSRDPLELVREFLGREPNNEAFIRSLGL